MRRVPFHPALLIPLALIVVVAITRPWTVRPLGDDGRAVVGPARFDLETFVGDVWTKRLPAAVADAEPVSAAGLAPKLLRGEGRVTAVNTQSRVGTAEVDLEPEDGIADLTLMVGPVVIGSAVRDALGLQFADFETQVDYANVSSRLNARALAALPEPSTLNGRRVAFVAAGAKASDGRPRLTPVQLKVGP